MQQQRNFLILVSLLALLFVSHTPFIGADPDIDISFSRGPFTDEGLNTIQLRNFIDHGNLDIDECDNLLKTPLLNLFLSFPFLLLGTDLETGRLAILYIVLALFLVYRLRPRLQPYAIVFVLIALWQYHVFHFTHFSLSEMLCVGLIIASIPIYYGARVSLSGDASRRKQIILASLLVSATFLFKIQFLYLLVLFPSAMILEMILFRRSNKKIGGFIFQSSTVSVILLLIFILAWYLPFRTEFEKIMAGQSGVFEVSGKSWEYFKFNLTHWFFRGPLLPFVIAYGTSIALLLTQIKKRHTPEFKVLLPVALAWNLLEFHKLIMVYLPTRYQVSLIASLGFTIALVIVEFHSKYGQLTLLKGIRFKWIIYAAVSGLMLTHSVHYAGSLSRRTYVIEAANHYIHENYRGTGPVIGAWAPTLTWRSSAYSFPVWDQFLNYEDPINSFHPEVIVSEPGQDDSNQAYLNQGIDLQSVSDSSRCFTIGQWEVCVYWMK
jgi:hypothetical protein